MIVLYKCDNFLWAERKKNIATTLYVCENSILYLSVQTEKSLQSALPSPPLPSRLLLFSSSPLISFSVSMADTCRPTQNLQRRAMIRARRSAANRWLQRTNEEKIEDRDENSLGQPNSLHVPFFFSFTFYFTEMYQLCS